MTSVIYTLTEHENFAALVWWWLGYTTFAIVSSHTLSAPVQNRVLSSPAQSRVLSSTGG